MLTCTRCSTDCAFHWHQPDGYKPTINWKKNNLYAERAQVASNRVTEGKSVSPSMKLKKRNPLDQL